MNRYPWYCVAFCLLWMCSMGVVSGQQSISLVRADSASVSVTVYDVQHGDRKGIAIISPGAGGTEKGMGYLAKALSSSGWFSIVVGHNESGPAALRKDLREEGLRGGLLRLTTDKSAYIARQLDLQAALAWARSRCGNLPAVLIGHSMGAATAMLVAGAANELNFEGEDVFNAYVAMSPQGPGSIFPEEAWGRIKKPVLLLTGTNDNGLEGTWAWRIIPFTEMCPGAKWLGVIDGATHLNFAGIGVSHEIEALTIGVTLAFLNSLLTGNFDAPPNVDGITVSYK